MGSFRSTGQKAEAHLVCGLQDRIAISPLAHSWNTNAEHYRHVVTNQLIVSVSDWPVRYTQASG